MKCPLKTRKNEHVCERVSVCVCETADSHHNQDGGGADSRLGAVSDRRGSVSLSAGQLTVTL